MVKFPVQTSSSSWLVRLITFQYGTSAISCLPSMPSLLRGKGRYNSRRCALLLVRITKDSNNKTWSGHDNGGVPHCNVRATECSSNEVYGRWSRWQKPCQNLGSLDDDDVLGTVHLLGGVIAAVLPPHLASAPSTTDVQRKHCARCTGRCPPPHIKSIEVSPPPNSKPDIVSCSSFINGCATF